MKALPPPPSQLELVICRNTSLMIVESDLRSEVIRALAEILLAAAEPAARVEQADEAR
jgi:hypothetical protein